jgi:hypothetical protein
MTTNNNTADDAIFDNDSDVTDVDTGAVGVAAVRTPNRASAGLRVLGGVADDPCAEPVPAPEVAWLSSWPAARARPSSNCAPPSTISTCAASPRAPPSSTRPAESPPTADRQSLRAHAPHRSQPPPNSGSFSRRWQRLKRTLELA